MKINSSPLPQSRPYQRAEKLMAEHDVPVGDHFILRENLASYLAQIEQGSPAERWEAKIDRDLSTPYTDAQVFEKLDQLEEKCKLLAGSTYPIGKWHISGSIPKGRFGANSDVDLTCDAAFRPGQIETLNSMQGWEAGAFHEGFQSGDPNLIYGSVHGQDVSAVLVGGSLLERKLSEYDSVVPLEVRAVEQEHGFLADVYVKAMQAKGYQISRQGVTPPEHSPPHPLEKIWTRPS